MFDKLKPKHMSFVKKISKFAQPKLLKKFIEYLYSDVSYADLKNRDENSLYMAGLKTFETFKTRLSNEPVVKATSLDDENILVQIINRDMPFLLDSVSNEFKQQKIEILFISHPIIPVKRNEKGNLIDIASDGAFESVIHIQIEKIEKLKLDSLIKRLKEILKCVYYSVEDWPTMNAKMIGVANDLKNAIFEDKKNMKEESVSFLEWISLNNFVFLGYASSTLEKNLNILTKGSTLGILRSSLFEVDNYISENDFNQKDAVFIKKWDKNSVVHRNVNLDVIVIKTFDKIGKVTGLQLFFGLFTSSVYYQSVRNIPLVRKKVKEIIERYGYPLNSYNCKELVTAMESFPRGELLQMSADELYETATGIVKLSLIPKVRVFFRNDSGDKFVSCIVFIPGQKFSIDTRNLIEDIICRHLNGVVTKRYVQMGESSLTRLQLIIKLKECLKENLSSKIIEREVIKAISNWSDSLLQSLNKRFSYELAKVYFNKYKDAFDVKYKSLIAGNKAVHDILLIEKAIAEKRVCFDTYQRNIGKSKDYIQIKIYSLNQELPLSSTLPKIENLGLFIQDMQTFKVNINNGPFRQLVYIHHFRTKLKLKNIRVTSNTCDLINEAFEKIWEEKVDNDGFNSLIIATNSNWRLVNVMRSYAKYLKQTKYVASVDYTLEVLLANANITKDIIKLFELKFDPSIQKSQKALNDQINLIKNDLDGIKSFAEDKVMRSFLQVVNVSLRTNFYQKDSTGHYKDYLSYKINSKEAPDLPSPRPYVEIFVYSTRFEGIHLRGGRVARGGLRWSDRKEDFRTEVLGLMKAQMTKNSVIVPTGSKGGYVLKCVSPADGNEAFLNEGIQCYQKFLCGLLDLTDNVIQGKIIPPHDVIRYDNDDPYLVVAADKGTASFSDYANAISEKYGFWLGDAFASGGSAGYDHKKMAITARGGWISVVRHFEEMGIDITKTNFTCVGIGDMSGDVFGNGMLLSDKMKVLAAFNHMHIFLDPNPDPEKSFKERKRLFALPSSQWSDYNPKILSKGGGVFERKSKSIAITPEVKAALNIKEDALAPDELIRAILKAPVDLLWNGGIGTYVKSKLESNEKIGDKANDNLRINGSELRCKIVGEGGNLGFTQLGRIEYARVLGRINTDFIDNSAGVDCSDHEVNIKIALNDVLLSGKLKKSDRDILLEKMTDEIADLVLDDNFKQTQILSLEQQSKQNRIFGHSWLIKYLSERSELDREIEFLPMEDDLKKLVSEAQRLTRPEISVLLAYAKNSAVNMLSNYDFSEDKFYLKYLHNYFPIELSKKYPKLIESHKLKKEIIVTVLVNDFINTLGCTFFHQVCDETGKAPEQVIKAYTVVKAVYDTNDIWKKVEDITTEVPFDIKLELFGHLQSLIERNITWLLNNYGEITDVQKVIDYFSKEFEVLKSKVPHLITDLMKVELRHIVERYSTYNEAAGTGKVIAHMRFLKTAFDIIMIARENNRKLEEVAKKFYSIGDQFYLRWLISQTNAFSPRQYFQIFAMRTLISKLQQIHMNLTAVELKLEKSGSIHLKLIEDNPLKFNRLTSFINELKMGDPSDAYVSKLTMAIKKIEDIAL